MLDLVTTASRPPTNDPAPPFYRKPVIRVTRPSGALSPHKPAFPENVAAASSGEAS